MPLCFEISYTVEALTVTVDDWGAKCNKLKENIASYNSLPTSGSLRSECNVKKQEWFWCQELDTGRIDGRDKQRPGWPSTSSSNDVCHVEGLNQAGRRDVRQTAHELSISTGSVVNTGYNTLGYWKKRPHQVPRQFSDENKAKRVHLMR